MGLTELLLVLAVGGGIIAVLYPTLRGAAQEARTIGERESGRIEATPGSRERAELDERRRAVIRSLAEIDADREAGNLSDADFRQLRQRYEREAALVLTELEAAERAEPRQTGSVSEPEAKRALSPGALAWVAGVIGFTALAGVVLSSSLRPRGEGDTITGSLPVQGADGSGTAGALIPIDAERMAVLEKIVAGDSSQVDALVELGHLYLASQRFAEAAQLSMKALSLDPHTPAALAHLGMVLVAANHTDDALEAFDRALAIDPDFAEALLYRGIVLFRNSEFVGAVESWERYLAVAPADADVSRVRAMLEGARQAARARSDP